MRILAIHGSPRRQGNSSLLLEQAIQGARTHGAIVEEVFLRDLTISPCLEIYGCRKSGRCVIDDDFQGLYDSIDSCDGIIIATPIFFYTVSAHVKILMDRCQSFWVRKNMMENRSFSGPPRPKKGLVIAVGATRGKRLFDGALLTFRYFFDALDVEPWRNCLFRGLDFIGDVNKHPASLEQAFQAGEELCAAILNNGADP